ncbi:adenylyl-sulfate kinase [Chloroflexi bacterium TSY]|nr:adenylyl-sulfate kinase [Chloroflexi bacterium TSY]
MTMQITWAVWFTGLPASGKTTIAQTVRDELAAKHVQAVLLDSDELRAILTATPTYKPEERDLFYGQIVGFAHLLAQQGFNVLIAATANRRVYREAARKRLPRFYEVWVHCPVNVCRERDPKGHYAEADGNPNTTLPGVGTKYEPPCNADVLVDTTKQLPLVAANQVISICSLAPTPKSKGVAQSGGQDPNSPLN